MESNATAIVSHETLYEEVLPSLQIRFLHTPTLNSQNKLLFNGGKQTKRNIFFWHKSQWTLPEQCTDERLLLHGQVEDGAVQRILVQLEVCFCYLENNWNIWIYKFDCEVVSLGLKKCYGTKKYRYDHHVESKHCQSCQIYITRWLIVYWFSWL